MSNSSHALLLKGCEEVMRVILGEYINTHSFYSGPETSGLGLKVTHTNHSITVKSVSVSG